MTPAWAPHQTPPSLARDALHLWRVRLIPNSPLHRWLAPPLSPEETLRAQRYVRDSHASLWAQARRALRAILAHYTRADALSLEFTTGPHGKPHLRCGTPHFNLSHSHHIALLAISHQPNLGVDVEHRAPTRDFDAMARRVFSPAEQRALSGARTPHAQRDVFYSIWTQKEAYIKALGLGLHLPLDSFDVDAHEPAILAARHNHELKPTFMSGGLLEPSYAFAVCTPSPPTDIHYFEFTMDESQAAPSQ